MIKFEFKAANGVPFLVRVLRDGDRYGRGNCLVCESRPMVEFYDRRYDFEPDLGQFVQRYYVSTLLESPGRGLLLEGGVEAWQVDPASMIEVKAFLKGVMAAIAEVA